MQQLRLWDIISLHSFDRSCVLAEEVEAFVSDSLVR